MHRYIPACCGPVGAPDPSRRTAARCVRIGETRREVGSARGPFHTIDARPAYGDRAGRATGVRLVSRRCRRRQDREKQEARDQAECGAVVGRRGERPAGWGVPDIPDSPGEWRRCRQGRRVLPERVTGDDTVAAAVGDFLPLCTAGRRIAEATTVPVTDAFALAAHVLGVATAADGNRLHARADVAPRRPRGLIPRQDSRAADSGFPARPQPRQSGGTSIGRDRAAGDEAVALGRPHLATVWRGASGSRRRSG